MTRCPPEYGPKDPLVNAVGWFVVAAALALGALLSGVVVRRSRGMRWSFRAGVIVLGLVGTAVVWVGGFALALVFFFLTC